MAPAAPVGEPERVSGGDSERPGALCCSGMSSSQRPCDIGPVVPCSPGGVARGPQPGLDEMGPGWAQGRQAAKPGLSGAVGRPQREGGTPPGGVLTPGPTGHQGHACWLGRLLARTGFPFFGFSCLNQMQDICQATSDKPHLPNKVSVHERRELSVLKRPALVSEGGRSVQGRALHQVLAGPAHLHPGPHALRPALRPGAAQHGRRGGCPSPHRGADRLQEGKGLAEATVDGGGVQTRGLPAPDPSSSPAPRPPHCELFLAERLWGGTGRGRACARSLEDSAPAHPVPVRRRGPRTQ